MTAVVATKKRKGTNATPQPSTTIIKNKQQPVTATATKKSPLARARRSKEKVLALSKQNNVKQTRDPVVRNELGTVLDTSTTDDASNEPTATVNPTITATTATTSLPRTLEESIRRSDPTVRYVLGIDEAGRGPLAGPVVAAAVCLPAADVCLPPNIVDSKKITSETMREYVYDQIVQIPNVHWAVAVVDAATIDQINILQATLLGMRVAAATVMGIPSHYPVVTVDDPVSDSSHSGCYVMSSHSGCYVMCKGGASTNGKILEIAKLESESDLDELSSSCYALIDGNRVPEGMPCRSEAIVKGDGREFCIAAASILAKVTRDRLMHTYDKMYPEYNLRQHKGYPTAAHMQAVRLHGASPIHRRTFAPLKHMNLDPVTGRVLENSGCRPVARTGLSAAALGDGPKVSA